MLGRPLLVQKPDLSLAIIRRLHNRRLRPESMLNRKRWCVSDLTKPCEPPSLYLACLTQHHLLRRVAPRHRHARAECQLPNAPRLSEPQLHFLARICCTGGARRLLFLLSRQRWPLVIYHRIYWLFETCPCRPEQVGRRFRHGLPSSVPQRSVLLLTGLAHRIPADVELQLNRGAHVTCRRSLPTAWKS